jgi:CHAT domain-containing protein
LHFGLLAANQPQRDPSATDAIQAAILLGKSQRTAGYSADAIREFTRALKLARERGDRDRAADCLNQLAISHSILFEYRVGLASAEEARRLALQLEDYALAGSASANIATVYGQLGDFASAEREASRSVDFLQRSANRDSRSQGNLVKALLNRALLSFLDGRAAEGQKWSDAGLALANRLGDPALQALAWKVRGTILLRENDVSAADAAFAKECSLRQSIHDEDGLAVNKEHFAELELEKVHPDYPAALKLIDEAFAAPSHAFKANAQYYPIHVRAKILIGCGRKKEALAELRRAVDSADQWRQGALPGNTTSTQTVAWLNEVYVDFAELAAEMSLENHDPTLLREGLEVLARNRAASLREQLMLAYGKSLRLPDSYFKKLSELQSAQARVTLGRNSDEDTAELARIRFELADLENQIGIKLNNNVFPSEKNSRRISLKDIQARLSREQVVLSFCLGKKRSFLWAVAENRVNLYQLDSEREIAAKAARFADSVRGGLDMPRTGADLGQALFGQLAPEFWQKPEWLIVGDGALLNGVPFADLPDPSSACCQSPLIAKRTLRFLPSELLLLGPKVEQPERRFVGVADPIYNAADSRLARNRSSARLLDDASTISLARLVGSEKEIRTAARLSGMPDERLLVGPQATAEDLQRSLAEDPELVHFAVHVVSPPGQAQQAALALSLKEGIPELLTPEAIATYRVPGSLIILSGCSSGQGRKLPGAGLVGLSRAWLLAGAAAVIVSAWPTPDDSGRFFSAFYNHFQKTQSGTLAQRAATSLQQAQLDMRRNGGYGSSPSLWAAYSIISKE